MEEAIVDAHCTTSADKWAFVSIAINDSKRHGGELSIYCAKRRGRRGTRGVLRDTEEIHLQITDRWRGPLFQEERGCLCVWTSMIRLDLFRPAAPSNIDKSEYTQIWYFYQNILYLSAVALIL